MAHCLDLGNIVMSVDTEKLLTTASWVTRSQCSVDLLGSSASVLPN